MQNLFFSILVPAHNEEQYIESTLEHLKRLEYPAERLEVIVIENGSTDRTFELAKKFEGANFKVLQSAKGVSRAKNLGIDNLARESDWVIFLDADTVLEKDFLQVLDRYLRTPNNFTVGTVSLRPLPETPVARFWFLVYNVVHMLSKTSFSLKLVKRSLFPPLRFDENVTMGEDLLLIEEARKRGEFFYLWTRNVFTSTRRFEKLGWLYISFYWIYVALLPDEKKRRYTYDVIR